MFSSFACRLSVRDAHNRTGFDNNFMMLAAEDRKRNANPALFSDGLQNVPKNRYHDIVPFNETRVKLGASPVLLDNYINASHLKVVLA